MAGNQSIDHYLSDLRERLAMWHRRPDDVVDEAADHLTERSAELERRGVDAHEASARAIDEYGTARQIADAHLRAARRPAIPTADTRALAVAAMLGGVGWIVLPVLAVMLPDVQAAWIVLATIRHATIAASTLGCVALWQRHGGLGPLGYAAWVPAVAAAPFVFFAWPVPAWTILLGVATLLFGLAVLFRRVAPVAASLGLACGLALTAGGVLGAELIVGAHDEDFAFVASRPAGALTVVGMMTCGLSLLGIGRWLRSEEPVEIPALPAPSAKR